MSEDKEEVAGYREAPDQQKVGGVEAEPSESTQEPAAGSDNEKPKTDADIEPGTAPYDDDDDKGTPDYGSNSPDSK